MLKYDMDENQPVVIISLFANPLGQHHIDYIQEASRLGNVYAIVNNDQQVKLKKSKEFQNEQERLKIVSSIRNVFGARLSIDTDSTVVETLKIVRRLFSQQKKIIFFNSGDRVEGKTNSAEEEYCRTHDIELVYSNSGKTGSSSETLQNFINRYWTETQLGPRYQYNLNPSRIRGIRSNNLICDDYQIPPITLNFTESMKYWQQGT